MITWELEINFNIFIKTNWKILNNWSLTEKAGMDKNSIEKAKHLIQETTKYSEY